MPPDLSSTATESVATGRPPSVREALRQRYGASLDTDDLPSNDVIELLLRHRTVRRFLPGVVDDRTLRIVVAAAQSAATSANLQLTSVVAVRDPRRRDRLATLSADQQLIRDAGVFLVWVADWARPSTIAQRHGHPTDALDYIDSTISGVVDATLAAQNAAIAAESLGYGVTFVGALRNQVDAVCAELALPPRAFPLFGMAIGIPDPDDPAGIKPRFAQTAVVHQEQYSPATDDEIAEYGERLNRYYTEQELPADWVQDRLAWRVSARTGLAGRRTMRASLNKQGFPLL